MTFARRAIASLASAALLASAAPAFAGGWGGTSISAGFGFGSGYGRGYGRKRWRGRDRVDAGDVIAGIAVIGVIAAIASSASKNKQRRQGVEGRGDRRIVSEDQAVDACALAAEDQAGRAASVRDITQVDRNADGWDVEGTIEERSDYRDRTSERRRFTCSVRFGGIEHVYIDTDAVALR